MEKEKTRAVRVIESFQDDLVFERAYIVEENGILEPFAVLSGVVCRIRTDPAPLADGIAVCAAIDRNRDSWPVWVVVQKESVTSSYQETMWGFTANARIVAAARKFDELIADGSARPGLEL